MSNGFDAIIIGSGFGGAVTAYRLAEAGARVLVLERGRRWTPEQYPRQPTDAWLYDHTMPEKLNGWLDMRFFHRIAVIQGAGVGGGSQCYSSVVMRPNRFIFDTGWPPEITFEAMEPYFAKVDTMLGVRPIPETQHTKRFKLLVHAAEQLGYGDRVQSVPLALSFDPAWNYALEEPFDTRHSQTFTNAQGQRQGTCIHLGDCDIGCPVRAKNTLDLNYIPAAEQHGAEVRPLHLVQRIEPAGSGYRVHFDRLVNGQRLPGTETAERVVLAAGSLGSTELLLRCRDIYRTLPRVSSQLGQRWSANANFFTFAMYHDDIVDQSIGPTISSGLEFMDGAVGGQHFFIEDDGFPNLLRHTLNAKLQTMRGGRFARLLREHLERGLDEKNPLRRTMVWLGEGIDGADGQLRLARRWWQPWHRELQLRWDVTRSQEVIEAEIAMHRRLSEATGGTPHVPSFWTLLRSLVTVHPLGGCRMGESATTGVVDHRGEVFGHPNLYVADGAILSAPTGRNPSMTIAALAERVAAMMVQH